MIPFRVSIVFCALFFLFGCGNTKKEVVLTFTAIPGDNTTELSAKFKPLEKYLSEKLSVKVQYVPTADYAAAVDSFVNGDVHLAWFGGLTGIRARRKVEGARAIAQGVIDPRYKSYFIAHKDSGLKLGKEFPEALRGKKFAFGSSGSTSGRLMPTYFIKKFTGETADQFFGSVPHFSGSHEKTAQLVSAGTFHAGAIDYKTYDRLVAEKKIDPKICYVIWTTPVYPDYNWTAHPDLDRKFGEGMIDRLQKTMIEMTDSDLLKAINRQEGLIPAKNEEWDDLAGLAKELGLLR
jgi:phosphonate transport system substrate-binding protein